MIDFEVPLWLFIYYHFIGTVSLFLNVFTIILLIFKSESIDSFRYSLLVFQATCTVTDIHFTFFMQPVPLLPILSGYCVGFLARCLDIWSHYLIALVVGMIVAQLESLAYFFVRKHQTIANITRKHVVAKNVNDAITMMLPFFPLFGYMSFCKAGMKREEQMEYVKEHYPEYVTQFSSLPNFAIYEPNFWFYLVISFGFFGGIFCGCIFTYTTIDMFQMLRRARRKISATNFRRHRSTVKSLLAQFAASSLLLIPLFGFSVVILSGMEKSQFIIHVILAVFFVEKFGECVGFDCHDTSISKFCDEPRNHMTISFETPIWLVIYYHIIGTVSLFLCSGTIFLVIFKSENIDNFRHALLIFQITCTITDIHLSFLMQPLPLFPVMSGYSVGYLARLDVWTHYLIAFIVSAIVAQLESLTFCFVKKHQTIANITKEHVVPERLHNFLAFCLPFAPLTFFVSFCEAGMKREEQMEYVRENHPEYLSGFSTLSNFAIYQLNSWFLFVILMAFGGGIVCVLVFTLSTIDMFRMLRKVRKKISILNFRRHRSTVKSLLAQFAASSLLLIPLFCFVIVIMLEVDNAQVIIQITLAVFSLRSSVNAIVLVFTTPPYRNYILRKRHARSLATAGKSVSMVRSSYQ